MPHLLGQWPRLATSFSFLVLVGCTDSAPRKPAAVVQDGTKNTAATTLAPGQSAAVLTLLTPAPVSFGTVVLGGKKDLRLDIKNTGGATALLSPPTLPADGPFAFNGGESPGEGGDCGGELPAGHVCRLRVVFTPTAVPLATAVVRLDYYDGAANRRLSLEVKGSGQSPADLIVVEAAQATGLDFGDLRVGTSRVRTLVIRNNGPIPARALKISLSSTSLFDFKDGEFPGTGGNCAGELAPQATCRIVIAFSPTQAVECAVGLNVSYHDGAVMARHTDRLTGTGLSPAQLILGPAPALALGTVLVGDSRTYPISITNRGKLTALSVLPKLEVPGLSFRGGFPGEGGTCGTRIAPGETCQLGITFAPTRAGDAAGTVSVRYVPDTGLSNATVSLAVSGKSSAPARLLISDGPVFDFGSIGLGDVVTKTMRVTNAGEVRATNIRFAGFSEKTAFSLSGPFPGAGSDCGLTLEPGRSCTFTFRFAPRSADTVLGVYSGSVSLGYENGLVPATASRALLGKGVPAYSGDVAGLRHFSFKFRFSLPVTVDAASARIRTVSVGVGRQLKCIVLSGEANQTDLEREKCLSRNPADGWTDWIDVRHDVMASLLAANQGGKSALLFRMQFIPAREPTDSGEQLFSSAHQVPFEIMTKVEGAGMPTLTYGSRLIGRSLGLAIVPRENPRLGPDGLPLLEEVIAEAQYNQRRYWTRIINELATVPAEGSVLPSIDVQPRLFPIYDTFIGDADVKTQLDGHAMLARLGINTTQARTSAAQQSIAFGQGITGVKDATYIPPSSYWGFSQATGTPEKIDEWITKKFADLKAANSDFDARKLTMFGLSDEPAWYFPAAYDMLNVGGGDITPADVAKNLGDFRSYLVQKGMSPALLGVPTWSDVRAIGRGRVLGPHGTADLRTRRLYAWSARYFSVAAARNYVRNVAAVKKASHDGVAVYANFNNDGLQSEPGAMANNLELPINPETGKRYAYWADASPDSATGGMDWFDFAREGAAAGAAPVLWSEDWFHDYMSYRWGFLASLLRSASLRSGKPFGGFVVPVASNPYVGLSRVDQKAMALIGHGAKYLGYFTFGPEHYFPTNCYSDVKNAVFASLRHGQSLIARAEDVLYPGVPRERRVAVLMPQSSTFWDHLQNPQPHHSPEPYRFEMKYLFDAFTHANIQADFIDEEGLADGMLDRYRVLYVLGPNLPSEYLAPIRAWLAKANTLVTVAGAAARDRYDERMTNLEEIAGIARPEAVQRFYWPERPPQVRINVSPELAELPAQIDATLVYENVRVVQNDVRVLASFADGSPLLTRRAYGTGQIFHYATMPGYTYYDSEYHAGEVAKNREKLGDGGNFLHNSHDPVLLKLAVLPIHPALRNHASASVARVETPVLYSAANNTLGVTVLNWTGETVTAPQITISIPNGKSVESVRSAGRDSALPHTVQPGSVVVTLPELSHVDVIKIQLR